MRVTDTLQTVTMLWFVVGLCLFQFSSAFSGCNQYVTKDECRDAIPLDSPDSCFWSNLYSVCVEGRLAAQIVCNNIGGNITTDEYNTMFRSYDSNIHSSGHFQEVAHSCYLGPNPCGTNADCNRLYQSDLCEKLCPPACSGSPQFISLDLLIPNRSGLTTGASTIGDPNAITIVESSAAIMPRPYALSLCVTLLALVLILL